MNSELLNALSVIKEYCDERDCCDCVFCDDDDSKCLMLMKDVFPYDWDIFQNTFSIPK